MEKSVLAGNGIVKMETGDRSMATGNQRLQGVAEVNTAYGAKSRKHGTGISIQRLLLMMAAVMMALAAFTACLEEDENGSDENGSDEDGDGNGGSGGGVSITGKRLVKSEINEDYCGCFYKTEYFYDKDGRQDRTDVYFEPSVKTYYVINTFNSDGTVAKSETFYANNDFYEVLNYTYDSKKKPLKAQGFSGAERIPITIDFTFQNGRISSLVLNLDNGISVTTHEFAYDSNGKRTTMTEIAEMKSYNMVESRKFTYTYNSDGTLQKVTFPNGYNGRDDRPCTYKFTWENGKTTQDIMDFLTY